MRKDLNLNRESMDPEAIEDWEIILAEHPPDDDEPVTEEWLLSVGFVNQKPDVLGFEHIGFNIQVCFLESLWVNGRNTKLLEITRGDVRRSCKARWEWS